MANIPRLPTGADLITGQSNGQRDYGAYCTVHVVAGKAAAIYDGDASSPTGQLLAKLDARGAFEVELGALRSETMPYVNRFLLTTGSYLLKDWRTPDYKVRSKTGKRAKSRVAKARAVSQPVVPTVAMVEAQPSAAVITVTADNPKPSASTNDPIPGMTYPSGKAKLRGAGRGWTNVDGVVVPTTDFETLQRAWEARQRGDVANVIVTGPAGTAKTMLVRAFAASLGVPFLKVDCSAVRTADDWSGSFRQDPNTKTWAHKWSPFALALRAGQPCVILLDELTRTESPAALNALLGLMDETGTLLVPDANAVLTMPKGILVVATANIGPEFVGTLPLDGAVRQRFGPGVRLSYPTEAIEAKLLMDRGGITRELADGLVRMAVQQRMHRDDAQLYPSGNVVSTRMLIAMSKDIGEANASPRDAIWSVLKGQFEPADDAALTVIVDTQFPQTGGVNTPPEAGQPATIVTERHYHVGGVFNPCGYGFTDGTLCRRAATDPIHLS